VQQGDSLWQIAARFGISLEELQQANNISDPGQVDVGAQLVIPGPSGISGRLDTSTAAYGDTLQSLSRRYQVSAAAFARLNRIVSPSELYAGAPLIVPFLQESSSSPSGNATLLPGQTVLELAVLRGEDLWFLALGNNLSGTWSALPNDVLQVTSTTEGAIPSGLPHPITNVDANPLQMVQGGTTVIKVYAPPGISMRGSLADQALNFFPQEYGYLALQGIQAMTPPGLYPLSLEGELPGGEHFAFSQSVLIQDAEFPYDESLEVNPATIDPKVTEPEQQLWKSLAVPVTPVKMWNGQFSSPVIAELKTRWTSLFGNRRSYNGGPYLSFHSGLDFCGQVGTELYAVAPGKVVYTNLLVVRGGVVVIDHGWGVYTAYDHLSKILVQPGDLVQTGRVIGLGGDTGRTTGPHLHWEVWVGGVQVNPEEWLNQTFP
jgi:murein DD-endopeptidase MepM/ murein hydrolase activator NlpD